MQLESHVDLLGAMNLAQATGTGSLTERVLLVLLGALLGFALSYALDRIKARREPRHRISWDLSAQRALIEVAESIKHKVAFIYDGGPVEALTHIQCTVSNTGNRVIKNHELRFPFAADVRVLEEYLNPKPEEELGVKLIERKNVSGGEQFRYRIAHFECGQSVTFNFVTAGGAFETWHPRSFNPDGDVTFQRRDIAVAKADQEHLFPFFLTAILLLTIPQALTLLTEFGYFGDLSLLAVRVGLLMALLPHVRPIVRVLQRLTTPGKQKATTTNSIEYVAQGHVYQLGAVDGRVTFLPPPNPPKAANANEDSKDGSASDTVTS